MKRSVCTVLLTLAVMACTIATARASALFPPTAVYEDQFVDVQRSDWFYANVASLYSLGLINGKGDATLFAPASDMTVAEILTMAARLRSLHEFGTPEAGADFFRTEGLPWYTPYVAYLQSAQVIALEFDGRFQMSATRAEMAHVLANTLPRELFEPINEEAVTVGYATGAFIPDVTEYTPYQQDILTLYRWGILSGMDTIGSFHPDASIRRSEVAAMVTRLVESNLRITLLWDTSEEEKEITSLSDLIHSNGTFHSAPAPDDIAAIDETVRYMLSRNERTLALNYGAPMTNQMAVEIMEAFLTAVRYYPEQTYNKVSVSYNTGNGNMALTFSCSLYDDLLLDSYREKIFSAAMQVRHDLYADGTLNDSMNEYDKALAYFTWLCSHCAYDFNCGDDSMSHSAYGAFYQNLAVCDGYTAAYNLLLKLEGIECFAIDCEEWDHMWTIAVLDGVYYHIDPTWGDQTNTVAYYYFGMTEEASLARFH